MEKSFKIWDTTKNNVQNILELTLHNEVTKRSVEERLSYLAHILSMNS